MSGIRWLGLLLGLVVIGAACGSDTDATVATAAPESVEAGPASAPVSSGYVSDGVVDCVGGQIERGVAVIETGASEDIVVQAALSQWVALGATLVRIDTGQDGGDVLWSAVLDDRDVARALPERNGSGDWVVHDVLSCGEPNTGPAPVDGEIDCVDDYSWSLQASLDPDVAGEESGVAAIKVALEPFLSAHGGRVEMVNESAGSLIIDRREQVTAFAIEVPAGGWAAVSIGGCRGFDR